MGAGASGMRSGAAQETRSPPCLPFLEGAASLRPGLKPIQEADWLTPDTEAHWLAQKHELMRVRRTDVYADLGGSDGKAAAAEAAAIVLEASGAPDDDWPTPLEAAAASVSDDLCVMRRCDASWSLQSASLCAPSFWRLSEMIGKPLSGLHGPVPGANDSLVGRIARMFDALQPGIILERFNWTVQAGGQRFTPYSQPLRARIPDIKPANALSALHLRVERQTIRKLPGTGALLFTIRVCIDPLATVLNSAQNIEALKKAWQTTEADLAAYKGWPDYEPLLVAALEQAGLALQSAKM